MQPEVVLSQNSSIKKGTFTEVRRIEKPNNGLADKVESSPSKGKSTAN